MRACFLARFRFRARARARARAPITESVQLHSEVGRVLTNMTALQVAFDYEHEHRFTEHEHAFTEYEHRFTERDRSAAKPIQVNTRH